MKLRAIRLYNVRQFGGRGVALEDIRDGLNSFAAPNETGKSTFFDALQELFFKRHSSKDGPVRSLQPYAGGNPHIEADVDLDGHRFRIAKRFLAGPITASVRDLSTDREIARQDAVQDWLNETLGLGDQAAGLAGLLWVRQGKHWDQGGGSTARGATLSDMVAEQLDAVTAGERMRAMMDRTAEELAPLVTPSGNPKSGGAYAKARDELDELQAEVRTLADDHARLLRDLEERQRLENDHANRRGDAEENERLKIRLTEAEENSARATVDTARLPELRSQLAAARKIRKDAGEKLEAFVKARTNAKALQKQIAETEARLPELTSAESETRAAWEAAQESKATADEALQQAEAVWQAAQSIQLRQERQAQLAELKLAQSKATAADQSARDARAAANLITIDRQMLDKIEKAAGDLETAKTHAAASVTLVEVDYLPGQSGRISTDGDPLPDGSRHDVTTPRTFEIDGIGRISVTPGASYHATDAAKRLSDMTGTLQTALSKAGVDDLPAARAELRRKEDLKQEALKQSGILETLARDGLDALKEKVLTLDLELKADEYQEVIDPDDARQMLDSARRDRDACDQALAARQQDLTSASTICRDASEELRNLKTRVDAELAAAGPPEQWDDRIKDLSISVGTTEKELEVLQEKIERLDGAEERHQLAQAEVNRLRQADRNRTEEIHRIELRLEAIKQRFSKATDEGLTEALRDGRARLNAAEARHRQIELRVRALQKLDDALKSAHKDMREVYFEPVNAELRPLLDRVLNGQSLVFNDNSFAPQSLQRDGRQEDIDRLSGGTQEQIAILTRLAFARLMARNGRPAPVILDDALIFTDDDRIEDMFTILNSMTKDLQMLVLTCRQRAFQSLGGNVLTLIDWVPEDD